MTTIPIYSKTTDPEAVAAVERNTAGMRDAHDRACEFAARFGADKGSHYGGTFLGRRSVSAIDVKEKPTEGRWTRGPGGRGWRPFKNNPISDEMAALTFQREPVPGLPAVIHGHMDSDGRGWVASPAPFAHNGVAYLEVNPAINQERSEQFAPQAEGQAWVEIKASEYHAAKEAYVEAYQAAQKEKA